MFIIDKEKLLRLFQGPPSPEIEALLAEKLPALSAPNDEGEEAEKEPEQYRRAA